MNWLMPLRFVTAILFVVLLPIFVCGQVEDNVSQAPIRGMAFSPDGKLFAASTADGLAAGRLAIWNTESWKLVAFRAEEFGYPRVVFSPDSSLLAVSRFAPETHLLDANTAKLVRELKGHTNYARSAVFSSDGTQLYTGSYDGTVRVWNVQTGEQIAQLGRTFGQIQHLDITRDDRYLAIADARAYVAHVWDLENGELLYTTRNLGSLVPHVRFSPSGDRLAVSTWGGYSWIFNTTEGDIWLPLDTNSCNWTSFSPDGARVAVCQYENKVFVFSFESPDIKTEKQIGNLILDFENEDYEIRHRAFEDLMEIGGAGEPFLREALDSEDAEVRWRVREVLAYLSSTKSAHTLVLDSDAQCTEFSSDGKFLATGDESGHIVIWDVADWSVVRRLGIPIND